jgi:protein-disulfide isomerase
MSFSTALAATVVIVALGFSNARAASSKPASASNDEVLATVGKYKITKQEVDDRLKAQLSSLEVQVYDLKKSAVEEMADDYLLKQAARKAHLSVDAYLKREVDSKIPEPPDAEVRKLYDQSKSDFQLPYDKAKPALIATIKDQEARQKRAELLEKLRSEHGLKILLKPPRFQVNAADAPSLGPSTAPVTIVEFGDFQNPYCGHEEATLKQVRDKYGDKVRLEFEDFPMAIHPQAFDAARAARCAGEQGKFWPFHDALLADQTKLSPSDLKATAARLKLDTAKFNDCFDKHKYDAAIHKDMDEGAALGVEGTPAFFINGRPLTGAQPFEKFQTTIDEELGNAQKQASAK